MTEPTSDSVYYVGPTPPVAAALGRLTEDDMYTLMGHAAVLRGEGQTDMPTYFFDLAERIATPIHSVLKHCQTALVETRASTSSPGDW